MGRAFTTTAVLAFALILAGFLFPPEAGIEAQRLGSALLCAGAGIAAGWHAYGNRKDGR